MQDGEKDDISWSTCFQFACDKAAMDTYAVKSGSEARHIVDTALFHADTIVRDLIKAEGGFAAMDIGKFIKVETAALKMPIDAGKYGVETCHATTRLLSHMREYLAFKGVTVPDNYSAYSAISKLPSLIDEAQPGRHRRPQ